MSKTRDLTVYICGHSPEAFVSSVYSIKNDLDKAIHSHIKRGYRYFAISLTRDAGMLAGEIVLKYKSSIPTIKLICVDVNENYHNNFSIFDNDYCLYDKNFKPTRKDNYEEIYQHLKKNCDVYKCLDSPNNSLDLCRKWIINKSSALIAVYCNGAKGFIKDTIVQAQDNKLNICIVEG